MNKKINRIKVVLSELKIKHKWLADKMEKNPSTISLWCKNERQLSLETIEEIAKVLDMGLDY